MKMKVVSVIVILVIAAAKSEFVEDVDNSVNEKVDFGSLKIGKCTNSTTAMITCLSARVLNIIDRIGRKPNFEIFPGIDLTIQNPTNENTARGLKNLTLSTKFEERAAQLFDLILDRALGLFAGRTFKIKVPSDVPQKISRSLEEGRAKLRKLFMPFILGIGAKLLAGKVALAFIGFLATKALVLAKIAFIISLVIAIPSLFSSNVFRGAGYPSYGYSGYGGYNNGYSYNYGPPSGYLSTSSNNANYQAYGSPSSYPYSRSIKEESSQDLAYSAHAH